MRKAENRVGPLSHYKNPIPPALALALLMLALLLGTQAGTQFFAHKFNYADQLGRPLYGQFYAPWDFARWLWHWYAIYPDRFHEAFYLAAAAALISFFLPVALIGHYRSKIDGVLHGSARWAQRKDILAAGLLAKKSRESVIVGAWLDPAGRTHWLRHSGPEHVLTYAPTRSGKGVGLVIPSLLEWPASTVVTDLKGELWELTAGWRSREGKNRVLRYEPAGLGSIAWNPLDEVRVGTEHEVADVQNLTTLIVDPDGKGFKDHWQKTAFALLNGVILYALLDSDLRATLGSVDGLLADPNKATQELWEDMSEHRHPVIAQAAKDMLDRPPEEAGSVLSTAKSYLALYRDPVIQRNTAHSDFKIRDLMHSQDPVSLYIVTQPIDKTRLRPLVRILISMIVRLLSDKMTFKDGHPVAAYKHRLLMMLDEFPSLGRLDVVQESLAFLAGYGIKCYLICQDINQLKSRDTGYGHDEAITSSCHVQSALPPNRIETAEYLSRLTGEATIIKEQVTTSGKRMDGFLSHVARTQQEIKRPLLTPDECLRLRGAKKDRNGMITEPGDMVVYTTGYPAIYGVQPLYFQDKEFLRRAQIPAPKNSTRMTRIDIPTVKIA